jgi:hypothetical protein
MTRRAIRPARSTSATRGRALAPWRAHRTSKEIVMKKRVLVCFVVGVAVGPGVISWGQSNPSIVITDGGIRFPDGTEQFTSIGGPPTHVCQTGQTTMTAQGDDGFLRMGAKPPWPRFTDNADGTVTDWMTGIVWLKDADCLGSGDFATALSQVSSLAMGVEHSCSDYTAGAYDDWRLPTIRELESLVDRDVIMPALSDTSGTGPWSEGDPFTGAQNELYWSSTAAARTDLDASWVVAMGHGYTTNALLTSATIYVWPMRDPESSEAVIVLADGGIEFPDGSTQMTAAAGPPCPPARTGQTRSFGSGDDGDLQPGVPWPEPRFANNGDGTVTDHLTGLIWLKDADCLGLATWTFALERVASLNSGTDYSCTDYTAGAFVDWRLPHARELASLRHLAFVDPTLGDAAGSSQWSEGDPFTGVQNYFYWTSTAAQHDTENEAWYVRFDSGVYSYFLKSNTVYVWPVRGGN